MTEDSEQPLTDVLHATKIVPTQENNNTSVNVPKEKPEVKVYKTRWVVLILFIFYSATTTYPWVEYAIISNIVSRYGKKKAFLILD